MEREPYEQNTPFEKRLIYKESRLQYGETHQGVRLELHRKYNAENHDIIYEKNKNSHLENHEEINKRTREIRPNGSDYEKEFFFSLRGEARL